ncbi:MAG TPA: tail fiber protein [Rhodopila sp.]|jgi:microcystin-dependent protein|nr:tail fiber protein [Rhodopila sp.]
MADMMIGEIRLMSFPKAPYGWLLCDGAQYTTSQYPDLFNRIGYTYGGSGVNFAVPDMRSRIPFHDGSGYALGQPGGTETVTLTANNLPSHNHAFVALANLAVTDTPHSQQTLLGNPPSDADWLMPGVGTPAIMSPDAVSQSGGGSPHDNCMPTLPVNFCIAYTGSQ